MHSLLDLGQKCPMCPIPIVIELFYLQVKLFSSVGVTPIQDGLAHGWIYTISGDEEKDTSKQII